MSDAESNGEEMGASETARLYRIVDCVGGFFHGTNGAYFLEDIENSRRGFITYAALLPETRAMLMNSDVCTDLVLLCKILIEQDDGSVTVGEVTPVVRSDAFFKEGELVEAHLVGLHTTMHGPESGIFRARTYPQRFFVPLEGRFEEDFLSHFGWRSGEHRLFGEGDIFHRFGERVTLQTFKKLEFAAEVIDDTRPVSGSRDDQGSTA